MITLVCYRQHAEFAMHSVFSYANLLKLSGLKNVSDLDRTSGEVLTVRLFNCLLDEVELQFKKKLITTTKPKIKIQLSEASGIAFYKLLLSLPVPADNMYFNIIRNAWIEVLDKQLN